jgi:copper resistance protein D
MGETMFTTLLIVARAVHIGASVLIAGTFTFDVVTVRFARVPVSDDLVDVERRLFRLALWSLVAALLSGLFWFWLEVASMNGVSLKNAFSATAWRTVLFETQFGRVWQLRLGLIMMAFVLIASALARDNLRRALILMLWMIGVVFLASLAWISHAAAAELQPLGVLGDALHLCAAGVWIGGLVPLAIFLACTRVTSSPGKSAVLVLQRFSTLSLCCVCVLVASGICNSWLLVGSIYALFVTPWGWLLLSKLTLFTILIGNGARNRLAIRTKPSIAQSESDLLLQLRRNVICEACLGVAVIAIVACLGVTPPARHP